MILAGCRSLKGSGVDVDANLTLELATLLVAEAYLAKLKLNAFKSDSWCISALTGSALDIKDLGARLLVIYLLHLLLPLSSVLLLVTFGALLLSIEAARTLAAGALGF